MRTWEELRQDVLRHVVDLQTLLPSAVGLRDREGAATFARDLQGAVMAVGLEEAAQLCAGLVPLLGSPQARPGEVAQLLSQIRVLVETAREPQAALPVLGARILVVDDDAVTRSVLAHILSNAGCDVQEAGGLAQARRLLAGGPLQAAVLDLHLGEDSGTALCREIRDDGARRALPILLLTGDGDAAALKDAYAAGADDFLVKPVRAEELVFRLGNVLRARKLRGPTPVKPAPKGKARRAK